MRTICLYFEIHQIIHLKRYRFFDIGTDHYYYDDYANETSINDVAERSYIPALNTLIEMVKNSGEPIILPRHALRFRIMTGRQGLRQRESGMVLG